VVCGFWAEPHAAFGFGPCRPGNESEAEALTRSDCRWACVCSCRVAPGDLRGRGFHLILTRRESEILALLADGMTQREIASRLFISPKTVGTHIQRILGKLGVHSRAQAVALAHRRRRQALRAL
jgi:DNA-binding CsgD family transcriptional regulator